MTLYAVSTYISALEKYWYVPVGSVLIDVELNRKDHSLILAIVIGRKLKAFDVRTFP
jgi:hypothetical protein